MSSVAFVSLTSYSLNFSSASTFRSSVSASDVPASDVSANDAFRPVSRYFDRITRPEQLLSSLPEAFRVLTDPAETGAVTLAREQPAGPVDPAVGWIVLAIQSVLLVLILGVSSVILGIVKRRRDLQRRLREVWG